MHLFELTKQHLPTTHLLNSLNGQSSNDTLIFWLHPGEKKHTHTRAQTDPNLNAASKDQSKFSADKTHDVLLNQNGAP